MHQEIDQHGQEKIAGSQDVHTHYFHHYVAIWRCWVLLGGVWMRSYREALLSEAGFEKIFRTQIWVRRASCVEDFVSSGHIGCCLNPLEVASYYFVASGGLIVCR